MAVNSAAFSQVARNALYVNIASVSGKLFNADGTANTALATVVGSGTGNVFRDMGKNAYLPAPTTPNAVAMQSTILRKVQFVPQGTTLGFYGTGGAAGNGARTTRNTPCA